MNPMLAPALPATPPGPSRSANANAGGKSDAAQGNGEFAECMGQARDAAAPEPKPVAANTDAEATTPAAPASDAPTPAAAAPAAAPDLSALLPGWAAPVPTLAAAADTLPGAGDGEALAPIAAQPAPAAPATTLAVSAARAAENAAAAATSAPSAPAHAGALPAGADAKQTPGESRSAAAETALSATPLPLPAAPSLLAAAPRAVETAAPFSAHLAAALDTPAFAPALATQVRWWAREGVQQAELTLNPPEMGPVAVKIMVFDGREARIDFSADLLATRNAIEAALPVLAAALDESGLKLSGGGVHDGTAQRQLPWQAQATPARSGRGGPGQDGDHAMSTAAPGRPAGAGRGLVDLIA